MAEKPAIGARIRWARNLKNWSQEELGKRVGKSVRAVNDWENDRKYPHNIPLLEAVLEVSLTDHEGNGDDDPQGSPRSATAMQALDKLQAELDQLRAIVRERDEGGTHGRAQRAG